MFGLRLRIWVVTLIAVVMLTFPALRQVNVINVNRIVEVAALISPDRAGSLEFRLLNEDDLLDRAMEKPLTGWGGWGRSRIYDDRGNDLAVTDGRWIIVLGQFGWIGYLGNFGLLTLPLLFLARTRKRKEVPVETIALALIATGNLIYMIPNATLTPVGLLVFGAVASFCMKDAVQAKADDPSEASDTVPRTRRTVRYSRFGNMHTRTP